MTTLVPGNRVLPQVVLGIDISLPWEGGSFPRPSHGNSHMGSDQPFPPMGNSYGTRGIPQTPNSALIGLIWPDFGLNPMHKSLINLCYLHVFWSKHLLFSLFSLSHQVIKQNRLVYKLLRVVLSVTLMFQAYRSEDERWLQKVDCRTLKIYICVLYNNTILTPLILLQYNSRLYGLILLCNLISIASFIYIYLINI